jgi:hypothetical protein
MKSIKLFGAQVQLIFSSPRRQASHLTPFRNSPPRGYISEQTSFTSWTEERIYQYPGVA